MEVGDSVPKKRRGQLYDRVARQRLIPALPDPISGSSER